MFDWLEELILSAAGAWWMPSAVFALCAIDGFFPVVPSESVLVALSAISDRHENVSLLELFLLGWVGAFIGDQVAYWLGRNIGTERFGWMRRRSVTRVVGTARRMLNHSGALMIITARHIPGGRVAMNFTAGAIRYRWRRFALVDAASAAVWAGFSIFIGTVTSGWLPNTLLQLIFSITVASLIGLVIDRIIKAVIGRKLPDEPVE